MTDKTADYRTDWQDIRQGNKPLAVFECQCSRDIWQQVRMADDSGQYPRLLFWYHDLKSDNRTTGRAVAIADSLSTLRQYQSLLQQQPNIPRPVFQTKLGKLFGYDSLSIAEFMVSETGRKCPCTLCGRDENAVKRSQPYA
jgi:hypothetical protein